MKKGILPSAMWLVFDKSFRTNLSMLGISDPERRPLMRRAKHQYSEILKIVPPFGKNDVLLINLLSAVMLAAVYMCLPEKPDVERMTAYYEASMNGGLTTRLYLKSADNFSSGYQARLKQGAEKSQCATNPYTWRYKFYPGDTLDSFDAIFDKCGICELMKTLGIHELTPALCAYDYGMAKLTGTVFTRETTLASGGKACDCHYRKKI